MNLKNLFIVVILLSGIGAAVTIVKTAPKPVKKPAEELIPLVEVASFEASMSRASWQAGAAVNANNQVKLVAQVAGQIVRINPAATPGRLLKKGTELAVIDDANYQLLVEQKRASVIQAQASLDIELAQVENAKKDYQRAGMKLNEAGKALALREPQLASAKAVLAIAKAELKKAQLDLQRTKITMPFDGHVLTQLLSEGSYVGNTAPIFDVLSSEQYWLEVKVPQSFINILDSEFAVEIKALNGDEKREGKILSVLPQVDAVDRQARVLISIENPAEQTESTAPIRYNQFVQVTLFAKSFSQAIKVKSDSLETDGNIWVVDKNETLQRRAVEILYAGREFSWVNIALQDGDMQLTSGAALLKQGHKVRLKKLVENSSGETNGAMQ